MKLVVIHKNGERKSAEIVQANRVSSSNPRENNRWSGSTAEGYSATADTPEELADALGGSR